MLFEKDGVKSHLIEEGASNKNYCREPMVFSKRSNSDSHLIESFSSQKSSKEDSNNNQ